VAAPRQRMPPKRERWHRNHSDAVRLRYPSPLHPRGLADPQTFTQKVQPMLANVSTSAIANALGVSWVYASHIRTGRKRPSPRHWAKLAELVGASGNQTANA